MSTKISLARNDIHISKLTEDLRLILSVNFTGCNGVNGNYTASFTNAPSQTELDILETAVIAHDNKAKAKEELEDEIRKDAKTQAQAIPNWAGWTDTEALEYIDANVVDIASAIVVIRAQSRMIIALRNEIWPDLEGG